MPTKRCAARLPRALHHVIPQSSVAATVAPYTPCRRMHRSTAQPIGPESPSGRPIGCQTDSPPFAFAEYSEMPDSRKHRPEKHPNNRTMSHPCDVGNETWCHVAPASAVYHTLLANETFGRHVVTTHSLAEAQMRSPAGDSGGSGPELAHVCPPSLLVSSEPK